MKWFGRLFCLVVAVSGFAVAQLLAQEGNAAVPTLPTVSVTVPTVPVPTVTTPTLPVPSVPTPTVPIPVPSTPSPTVPIPPPSTTTLPPATTTPPVRLTPVVTQPPVTTRATRPAQPPTSTTITVPTEQQAGGTSTPPSTGSAPSPSSASSGVQVPSGGASSTRQRQTKTLEARTYRSRDRVSVRLAFSLPKAEPMFLIVRGPAPSCRIAGYIPVRGREGVNVVFFSGRVHGRRLEPGVYLISLSTNRRLDPAAEPEYVRVVSPRSSVPLPDRARKPSCDTAAAAASNSSSPIVLAEAQPKTPKPRPNASLAGTAVASPPNDANDDGASGVPESGVLGAATSDADEQPFVAIAVLTIVGALLLTMLALVARFLRGSWNP